MQPQSGPVHHQLAELDPLAEGRFDLAAAQAVLTRLTAKLSEPDGRDRLILRPVAYFHDNGFLKVELGRSTCSKVRLRLHLWNVSDVAAPPQRIHNHSFDFISTVLRGSIRVAEFAVHADAEPDLHAFGYYRTDRLGRPNYRLRYIGPRQASLLRTRTLREGESYGMTGCDFHTADPIDPQPTSTLLISREHDIERDAHILFDDPAAGETASNAATLPAETVSRILRAHLKPRQNT